MPERLEQCWQATSSDIGARWGVAQRALQTEQDGPVAGESVGDRGPGNERRRPRFWGRYTQILIPGMLAFASMGFARDWRLGTSLAVLFLLVWCWWFVLWLLSDRWSWARERTERLDRGTAPPRNRVALYLWRAGRRMAGQAPGDECEPDQS